MKLVTISSVGYNSPTQANWSYGIYKIDLIDTKDDYCMSYTVSETFGGNVRFAKELKKKRVRVIEQKEYTTGQK